MKPEYIVIHHSASLWGDAPTIDAWHKANGWSGIGYHGVILNGYRQSGDKYNPKLDGKIEPGRAEDVIGAHCEAKGMNRKSLGVCLIGDSTKRTYSLAQLGALVHYCAKKCEWYGIPVEHITQHSDHDPGKPHCAKIDLRWLRNLVAGKL